MSGVQQTTQESRDLTSLVTGIFRAWREAGVAFMVLRNYEHLPEDVSNDIDVLLRPAQLAKAEELMIQAAVKSGFVLHNRAEFSPVSFFFFHPETLRQIQIDLFYNQQWRGFDLLPGNVVMDRRANHGMFSVPNPVHEAVTDLLTRLMFHGYVKENYKQFIAATTRVETVRMRETLEEIFGRELAGKLVDEILAENWNNVEVQHGAMRWAVILRRCSRQPVRTFASLVRDLNRFLARLIRPPGMTVALIGPDGCGKSTVADGVAEGLVHTFRPDKSLRVHWKPAVFLKSRREARPRTTDPHGKAQRNVAVSLAYLAYHWIEYFLGGWLHFLPVRFRNGLVLVDRYHYDFAVDPRRYQLSVSPALVRALFRFVPQPDLVFLLDAPAEVLQSRKAEVPIEETRRQCEAFRKLVSTLPNGRVINCDQPQQKVVADVVGEVLKHMRERQSRRGG